MYNDFYGFAEDPFFLTPDSRGLFLPENHKKVLDSILSGINERKAFMVVIGKKGIGKTTLIHHFIRLLDKKARTVFVSQDLRTIENVLEFILRDLGLPLQDKSKSRMIMQLEEYLIQQSDLGKTLVIIIDNAQNLSREVIEELRLLAGTDPRKPKLIHEIFVGNSKFEEMLNLNVLRQLKQRIAIRCVLQPFAKNETRRYIEKRIEMAGGEISDVFSAEAVDLIHEYSGGIPLLTNLICHVALVDGFALSKKPIDPILVGNAISIMDKPAYPQETQKRKLTSGISDLLRTRSLIMKIAYCLLAYSAVAWIIFLLLSPGKT